MSILDSFRLDGKAALVTGVSRGIGQAIAVALAEAGADIAGLERGDTASETGQLVEAAGKRYLRLKGDLQEASVQDLADIVDTAARAFGHLDILVNNAGTLRRGGALDFSEDDWDSVLQVDLKAIFFLSQAAGKVMVAQGSGKIINITSLLSFQGGIRVPSYTAAKSALLGLTRTLANEWAPLGINVNSIAPGYVATDITEVLRDDRERNAAILARIPVGRWATPEDMTGAAVFLASAASDYMHGATIPVDGGWLAR